MHKEQKAFYSIQAIQAPPQVSQLEGPPRICGLFSSTTHYTDQCHQIQEEYALAVANVNYNNRLPYPSQGQNNYSHGSNHNQGWRDNAHGSNQNQRWNNSSSHYNNNHQSSSQYHHNNSNHQANQNHYNQVSHQNHNNYPKYQEPHYRQQSYQSTSSSTTQGDDPNRALTQEQERLKGAVKKHEAQFGTITAQWSNITEILSRDG
ncbi:hypothetical protein HN51_069613 [Arachis hypogaea]